MENGFSIVMTPARLAAMMEGETGCPAVDNANETTQQSGNSEKDSVDKIGIVLKAGILKQPSATSSFTSVEIVEKTIN